LPTFLNCLVKNIKQQTLKKKNFVLFIYPQLVLHSKPFKKEEEKVEVELSEKPKKTPQKPK